MVSCTLEEYPYCYIEMAAMLALCMFKLMPMNGLFLLLNTVTSAVRTFT